ncbi:MAG: tetratricopeptide repeat protein [Deltaproteobacteria bacterium]|nr:tetratricopeptide repeat protein [Deltaproteobacteria bacterium]
MSELDLAKLHSNEINGTFSRLEIPSLIMRAVRQKLTGALKLVEGSNVRMIGFSNGAPTVAASSLSSERLGPLLHERGAISNHLLNQIDEIMHSEGLQFGAAAIKLGVLTKLDLARWLKEQHANVVTQSLNASSVKSTFGPLGKLATNRSGLQLLAAIESGVRAYSLDLIDSIQQKIEGIRFTLQPGALDLALELGCSASISQLLRTQGTEAHSFQDYLASSEDDDPAVPIITLILTSIVLPVEQQDPAPLDLNETVPQTTATLAASESQKVLDELQPSESQVSSAEQVNELTPPSIIKTTDADSENTPGRAKNIADLEAMLKARNQIPPVVSFKQREEINFNVPATLTNSLPIIKPTVTPPPAIENTDTKKNISPNIPVPLPSLALEIDDSDIQKARTPESQFDPSLISPTVKQAATSSSADQNEITARPSDLSEPQQDQDNESSINGTVAVFEQPNPAATVKQSGADNNYVVIPKELLSVVNQPQTGLLNSTRILLIIIGMLLSAVVGSAATIWALRNQAFGLDQKTIAELLTKPNNQEKQNTIASPNTNDAMNNTNNVAINKPATTPNSTNDSSINTTAKTNNNASGHHSAAPANANSNISTTDDSTLENRNNNKWSRSAAFTKGLGKNKNRFRNNQQNIDDNKSANTATTAIQPQPENTTSDTTTKTAVKEKTNEATNTNSTAAANKEEVAAKLALVRSSLQQGDYRKVLAICNEILAIEPHNPMAYRSLGIAYSALGASPQSCESFRRYLRYAPKARDKEQIETLLTTCK